MSGAELKFEIESLSRRERIDLATILELGEQSSTEEICERLRWMYWSRTRAILSVDTWTALRSKASEGERTLLRTEKHPIPDWGALVAGLAKRLKVYDPDAPTEVNELYISQDFVVRALGAMTAAQRKAFFDRQVELDSVMTFGALRDKRLAGPTQTVAALGIANTAGFSLYAASSTALGFVTHALGLTLPFAAYTGLSSTIAFVIGPAGWLTAGAYAFWKMTSTNWKELAPAIVYLIYARATRRLMSVSSSSES